MRTLQPSASPAVTQELKRQSAVATIKPNLLAAGLLETAGGVGFLCEDSRVLETFFTVHFLCLEWLIFEWQAGLSRELPRSEL